MSTAWPTRSPRRSVAEPRPTPLRREPIYVAAAALVLGGFLLGRGLLAAGVALGLAIVAGVAAYRLRRRLPEAAVGFVLLAAVAGGAAIAGLGSEPDAIGDVARVAGLFASAGALILYLAAIRRDDRLRAEAIREFSTPLEELLARRRAGAGRTERFVEVPWVLGRLRGARRILEVGHAKAEPFYLDALLAKREPGARVFGLDIVRKRVAGLAPVAGDIRCAPFRNGVFDLVLCISTLEHVGRDVSRYGVRADVDGREGMLRAAAELGRLVAPGGRLLLTVPFGRAADHGWLANISRADLSEIEARTGLEVVAEEFFACEIDGWRRTRAEELAAREYGKGGGGGASAVACVELRASL